MLEVFIDDFTGVPISSLNGATAKPAYGPVDVARAAVTVRRPVPSKIRWRSLLDLSGTVLQVLAVLEDGGFRGLARHGPMKASELLWWLDGTEKGNASYRVGTGVAHLLAQDLLLVDQVAHFDASWEAGLATLVSGTTRPDLIGRDHADNWAVIEAKGRSNGVDNSTIHKAKSQVENVAAVGSSPDSLAPPLYRIASVTDLAAQPLHAQFLDPPDRRGDDVEGSQIVVDPVGFARSYYAVLDDLRAEGLELTSIPGLPSNVEARGARLPGTTAWLGVTEPVLEALQRPDDAVLTELNEAVGQRDPDLPSVESESSQRGEDDRTSIGPDGFVLHVALTEV